MSKQKCLLLSFCKELAAIGEMKDGFYMDHFTTDAPQVKPAPKVTISTKSPAFNQPSRLASSRAMGIEADEDFVVRKTACFGEDIG